MIETFYYKLSRLIGHILRFTHREPIQLLLRQPQRLLFSLFQCLQVSLFEPPYFLYLTLHSICPTDNSGILVVDVKHFCAINNVLTQILDLVYQCEPLFVRDLGIFSPRNIFFFFYVRRHLIAFCMFHRILRA